MQLYLITHAHTEQEPAHAASAWQLSEKGEMQARLLAEQPFWSKVDQLVVSSEAKTRLTIEPVLAVRSLPVWSDARFDELLRPGWTEDYGAAVRQAFAEPDKAVGAWEPANVAQARFLQGVAELCERFSGKTVALVGHGLTLSLYRAYLLGQAFVDLNDWRRLSFAAVALVDPIRRMITEDFRAVAGDDPRG